MAKEFHDGRTAEVGDGRRLLFILNITYPVLEHFLGEVFFFLFFFLECVRVGSEHLHHIYPYELFTYSFRLLWFSVSFFFF
ncbi:hypothetical protein QBC36DRAFT_321797 [Triangularia setosa]|uniref:Uncharacterized protein n=1 Tax=Triangularia setosa TaxID=2587417 RepID=A0AAN6WDH6_9PEZI|nr:hypothetical protein QBC36DRAFT_321797 [Podospora setosa]